MTRFYFYIGLVVAGLVCGLPYWLAYAIVRLGLP
jgi:hypothetical protein